MKRGNDESTSSVAIIGASYAGLTLANTLLHNSKSIAFTVFESKTLPFTYVTGGDTFNVPCYPLVAKKVGLETTRQNICSLTREDVIESLLESVKEHYLIVGARIERIEERKKLFYLHTRQKLQSSDGALSTNISSNNINIHGPFHCVVGADGVRSKCRTSALRGTFLIGDARWVNDRWYDLGLRRIDRGANIAIQDGIELGEQLVKVFRSNKLDQFSSLTTIPLEMREKFCARAIHNARMKRIVSLVVAFIAVAVMKNWLMIQSLLDRAKLL